MSDARPPIPFFTDNDVADAVGKVLADAGHSVVRLRDFMLTDSPDPVIAAACREHGKLLLTHNIKHFKAIVKKYEVTKAQADTLCRIELGCEQHRAAERVAVALSVIEAEWRRLGEKKQGLRIFLGDGIIRLHR